MKSHMSGTFFSQRTIQTSPWLLSKERCPVPLLRGMDWGSHPAKISYQHPFLQTDTLLDAKIPQKLTSGELPWSGEAGGLALSTYSQESGRLMDQCH